MFKIETRLDGRWVLLGGAYRTREEAEEKVRQLLESTVGRVAKTGWLVQKRQYRIVW